jgi:hypothetical protein
MMVRKLVQFTHEQAKALEEVARRQKRPVAAVVRESVSTYIAQAKSAKHSVDKWERARLAVGGFRSGRKDIAVNHDKYLAEAGRW